MNSLNFKKETNDNENYEKPKMARSLVKHENIDCPSSSRRQSRNTHKRIWKNRKPARLVSAIVFKE
jgi:hypothetical protein